ncbi:putative CRISPR-associated protein [Myxococcota bacterium]|nr:putative CRISPR-associated protein [Myxococcota bacterium]MBU1898336.1 putative CRISPR-associated protein [Myxococcota bacterium]
MYHRIVLTAGTSALSMANLGEWIKSTNAFKHEARTIYPQEGQDEDTALKRWSSLVKKAPFNDPMRISAETSALNALQKHKKLANAPQIVLIHTKTFDGKVAAEIIEAALKQLYNATVERRAVHLDANREEGMTADLGAFIKEVADALREGDPRTTCFAPLGGYKVMTSLGYLAGAFMGYPTTYVHEEQQRLHVIPTLPIHIDKEALKALAPLIRNVLWTLPLRATLDKAKQKQLDEHSYLFYETEGHVGLSPFGEFLRTESEYRPIIGPRISVSKTLQKLSAYDLKWVSDHLERLLILMRNPINQEGLLHHEASFRTATRPDFHLYKAQAHGQRFFRAAWRYNEADDHLYVKEIWMNDHNAYEREVQHGALSGEPSEWLNLTDLLHEAR